MVYRRKGRPTLYFSARLEHGRWKDLSTGTGHKPLAEKVAAMWEELARDHRAWDLLNRVIAGDLDIGRLYDLWTSTRYHLAEVRSQLSDVDLSAHIPAWQAWLTDRVSRDSAGKYLAHLRTLMPEGEPFWRSAFTAPAVAQWLATRTALVQKRRKAAKGSRRQPDPPAKPISGSTKRKYLAAVQSFAAYLQQVGVLTGNPVRDVAAPPAADPRCVFLELPDVLRLVEGAPQPLQAIYALAYGAGLEISAILRLVETDVDRDARQVRARGTKAWTRDRHARVADWAWAYLESHLATVLPGERVFRGLDRFEVSGAHLDRLRALGIEGYRLHDARHHWAVRMARAGAPFELIARQLGHRDVAMVAKVYGRFKPDTEERDRWERIAGRRDDEKFGSRPAKSPSNDEKED